MKKIGSGYSPDNPLVDIPPYKNNNVREVEVIPLRRFVSAYIGIFAHAALFFYWSAFPLVNTIFVTGIPQLGTSAEYVSARYATDWWMVWLLTLNALLPITLAWAITNNRIEEWTRIHEFFSKFAVWINLIVFVVLTVRWPIFCNTPFSVASTACNDYRWCCVFFPSVWCPNTTPCNPAVTLGSLERNQEMIAHWGFSLAFLVLAVWNRGWNTELRSFRVLH